MKNWNNKGPLVLNLKSEGIEDICIEEIRKYKIKNWFFLDMSMPYFIKYSEDAYNKKIKNFLQIISPLDSQIKNRLNTLYHFKIFTLNMKNYLLLKRKNFKICLVSPEIQRNPILKET